MEENINSANKEKKRKDGFLKTLISGSLLSEKLVLNNLGLLTLLTLLGAVYIGNRFHAEKTIRLSNELQREVKELRSEALATSAELMYISKQSEVLRMINDRELGLKELKEPPYKLIVKD